MCKCNVLILICVRDNSSWCIDVKCVNMCVVIVSHGALMYVQLLHKCIFKDKKETT